MRELQSTVVVHSNQSEKEAIETRTVVNYNHSHALTILYYEVLRHFRVSTTLVRRRPVVLLKVRTDWFDGDVKAAEKNARIHRKALQAALLDPSLAPGFDALDRKAHRVDVNNALAALGVPPGPPASLPAGPPSPPQIPAYAGDREFRYFKFEMTAGGLTAENTERVWILASVVGHPGLDQQLAVMSNPNSAFLNSNGSFSQENEINSFFAEVTPVGTTVRWRDIDQVNLVISLKNDLDDVSFKQIVITGIDRNGLPQELVKENYDRPGALKIKHGPAEEGTSILLPVARPAPPAPGTPAPAWSAEDISDEIGRTKLLEHLKDHSAHYGRAVYLNRDSLQRAAELDGVKLADGSNLLEKVENRPIDLVGDYMAFPATENVWKERILDRLTPIGLEDTDERLVSLPTRGVFAEAKLGHCNASEEIDNTRFWDWQQSPIPHFAPEIAPTVPVTPQPQQQNLTPTALPSSIVNIVNPPNAPDPTGLANALNVLATPNLFRDMSGRAEVADLLKNLADNAVKIAGGKGGASGGTAAPAGGAAIGGPRAAPTQPSAVNRDLHDLGNVLGSAQTKGLITQDAAREVYTNAVSGSTAQKDASAAPLSTSELQSLPVSGVRISFSGSFQCRLATDPAPTDAIRTDPTKPNGGWTFDYGEAPFDRIIRLQSPVDLRSALIDPFVPVAVRTVEVRAGLAANVGEKPYRSVLDSKLLGLPVTLGPSAKFDSAAGGGAAFEAILDCTPTVGNLFKLTPKTAPKLLGLVRGAAGKLEYLTKKPVVVVAANATGSVVAPRKAVLADSGRMDFYSDVFGFSEECVPVRAEMDFISGDIPSEVFRPGWSWEVTLGFSRFDGDTLTGKFTGSLVGTPPLGEVA